MGRALILSKQNVPIARLTTFQNAGHVPLVLVIEAPEELAVLQTLTDPYFILGKGSNTVINPLGQYKTFVQISPDYLPPQVFDPPCGVLPLPPHTSPEKGHVWALMGAGTSVKNALDFCIAEGLSGLEFAAGIPASIGGMTVMNFGCWGEEMSERVAWVLTWHPDTQLVWKHHSEMGFGYRKSAVQDHPGMVVIAAILALSPSATEQVRETVLSHIKSRNDKQPIREKTFGSTFKNPPGHFAAALIESVGLKGHAFGGLKISERHANFLVNTGTATFLDLQTCLVTAQNSVLHTHHITLELEVKLAT